MLKILDMLREAHKLLEMGYIDEGRRILGDALKIMEG
jgi:hypothetical protein